MNSVQRAYSSYGSYKTSPAPADFNKDYITIPNYQDNQGKLKDIESFRKDVAESLNTTPENVLVVNDKKGISVKLIDSRKTVQVKFEDKVDLSRMAKYALLSPSMELINFGDEENGAKTIKIVDYEDGLSEDSQIQLFKEDVSREMKTQTRFIEITLLNDNIMAYDTESKKNRLVEFEDPADYERFLALVKRSKSKRLDDLGLKKHEALISIGGGTRYSDPKKYGNLTQEVSYSTFIGEEAKHRLKVDVKTDFDIANKPTINSLKEVTITYANSALPFTGTYGDIKVSYKDGKFDLGGKYEYLDLQVDKFVDNLKNKDTKTLLIAGGTIIAAGAGIYAASQLMDEKTFGIPIKTKVYSNGSLEVKANIEPEVTLGDGNFKLGMKKVGAEVKHNISSGTKIREEVKYNFEKKELQTEFEANHNRAYVKIKNLYSFEDPTKTVTNFSIGKSHTLTEGLNLSYDYNQEVDYKFESKNQNINLNLDYQPNENWRLNGGVGLHLPTKEQKLDVSATVKTTYRF